jgi:hypothetical protein
MRPFFRALVLVGLVASPALPQVVSRPQVYLDVADLPNPCESHRVYFVRDGATAADCSVGGGTTTAECACNDAGTGYVSLSQGAAGAVETSRLSVAQATHGFSAGQWLMHDDAGDQWELLDSTAIDLDNNAVGFVLSVEDVNNLTLGSGGVEPWAAHGFDLGPLYASSTPGVVTATTPALGTREWLVGVAVNSGEVLILQREWSYK